MNRRQEPESSEQPVLAVTGGASGIGFATAGLWAERGGRVVLLDSNPEATDAAAGELGSASRAQVTDVTDRTSVDAAFAAIAAIEGRLDALVNCAGNARPAPSAEITDEDWNSLLEVHLTGSMRCCRAAHPLLTASPQAAIVNISSIASVAGMPGRANYTTVKAGLGGLTRTLAVEWAAEGIRVNAIAPGYVRGAWTEQLIVDGRLNPAPIEARVPMRRFATPREVAEVINFLCSPMASYVTGATWLVDGGMSVDGNWYD